MSLSPETQNLRQRCQRLARTLGFVLAPECQDGHLLLMVNKAYHDDSGHYHPRCETIIDRTAAGSAQTFWENVLEFLLAYQQ